MPTPKAAIFLTFIVISTSVGAQHSGGTLTSDSLTIYSVIHSRPNKFFFIIPVFKVSAPVETIAVERIEEKRKFLQVNGDVSYSFFYRSRMDTPYKMQNLQEHNLRVNLHLLVNEHLPYSISFSTRTSNSPFFRNFFDVGFRFDPEAYKRRLVQKLTDQYSPLTETLKIDSLKRALDSIKNILSARELQLNAGVNLQKLVEAKERLYGYRQSRTPDDHHVDVEDVIGHKKRQADSLVFELQQKEWVMKVQQVSRLKDSIRQLSQEIQRLKNGLERKKAAYKQDLLNSGSMKGLRKAGRSDTGTLAYDKKTWRLAAIKNLAVGRTYLDFSELTAKNVVLTGFQMEYNPGFYAAVAVGKPEYNFRDFIQFRREVSGQKLGIFRLGFGNVEKRAFIVSVFGGAKNYSSQKLTDSLQTIVPLLGISLESIFQVGKHTSVKAEVAKSTRPVRSVKKPEPGSLLDFNDLNSMAYRVEGSTHLPETGTSLRGYFRKTGGQFQSFNYASFLSDHTAWSAQLDQSLLKRRLTITGALRKNDFLNPFATETVKSTAVFKSMILKLNVPRYPVLSIGFFPSTQYFISDNKELFQNIFYVLNSTVAYAYRLSGYNLTAVASYTKYVNKATGTGFTDYKGTDYSISGSIFMNRVTLEENINVHQHPGLTYFTNEAACEWHAGKVVAFGGGAQFNKVAGSHSYLGYSIRLSLKSGLLGSLRFSYNKSYHPGEKQTLKMYDMGRVSVFKNF